MYYGLLKVSRDMTSGELESRLEPGDVLVTTFGASPRWHSRMFKRLAPLVTGSYGHTGLYAGDGRVIEVVAGREGTREIDFSDMANRVNVKAFRPNLPKEDREQAVEFARSNLGAPYRNLAVLESAAEALAPGFLRRIRNVKDPETRAFLCTELVDGAYGGKLRNSAYNIPLAVDFMDPEKVQYVGQTRDADEAQWENPLRARFGRSRHTPQGSAFLNYLSSTK